MSPSSSGLVYGTESSYTVVAAVYIRPRLYLGGWLHAAVTEDGIHAAEAVAGLRAVPPAGGTANERVAAASGVAAEAASGFVSGFARGLSGMFSK